MDDVERRLAGEVAEAPGVGPGAAVVDRAAGGGGELADLVDLDVRLILVGNPRVRRLAGDHALPRGRALDASLREDRFRQDRVEEDRAARRLRPEHLAVPGDVEAPGVAAAAAVLLEGGAVRLEADDAAGVAAEGLLAVGRRHVADAVAMRRVDPAVETPAQVVDDGVRVVDAEPGVQLGALVSHLVAVRVFEEPDVGRRRRDYAVLVEDEPGDELELVGKDVALVHHAVFIGIREDRDRVLRLAGCLRTHERPGILPELGVLRAPAVGILRRFRDPEAAALVPVDVHRLGDQRLGRYQRQVEVRMHLDRRRRLRRMHRAAIGIAQRVAELFLLDELVEVRPACRPGDPAQQNRAEVRPVEVLVHVARDGHERAIRRLAAVDGALVGPHLRLDVVDADAAAARRQLFGAALEADVARAGGLRRVGRRQDAHVGHHLEIPVDLVVHLPVRGVLGDRALGIREVEVHRPFEPARRAVAPGAADDRLEPVGIARHDPGVDDDDAAAAGEELVQVPTRSAGSMLPASCLCRMRTSVSASCSRVGKVSAPVARAPRSLSIGTHSLRKRG